MFGPDLKDERNQYHASAFARPFPYDASLHPTGWIADRAIEWLSNRNDRAPLFLIVSFLHPHPPQDPPEPYASRYALSDARVPSETYARTGRLVPELDEDLLQTEIFKPRFVKALKAETVRRIHTYVRALIHQIDEAIGRITAKLDLDRTLLFFTSDHGDFGGHRGLLGKIPWVPFDDLAKVPFFCVGPKIPGGRRISEPVQSFDYVFTALEAAGVTAPAVRFDGQSLMPTLARNEPVGERRILSATSMGWPMVRHGRMKYIRNTLHGNEMLFDLSEDPGELNNLARRSDYAAVKTRLFSQWESSRREGEPPLMLHQSKQNA
jgi:choline-sulfatase